METNKSNILWLQTIPASMSRFGQANTALSEALTRERCPADVIGEILLAFEEIFVNISSYAYGSGGGDVTVALERSADPKEHLVVLQFQDAGVPFNPLAQTDPDVTLSQDEREPGGLGIFLTKQLMDDVEYEHHDGRNRLTIRKSWLAGEVLK